MTDLDEVVERAVGVLADHPSAFVTDIDGTLSRIVARPEDAEVSERARSALRQIAPHVELLAVITGREQAVARRMVDLDIVTYVGSYSLATSEVPAEIAAKIRRAGELVQPLLPDLPGVTYEGKDVSFALHYRNSVDPPAMRQRVLSLLEPIAAAAEAKVMEGKAVAEVAPALLPDKGTAFADLMMETGIRSAIFIGDDLADAAIFREIERRRSEGQPGLSIGVVDAETPEAVWEETDVQLGGVSGVEAFLEALAQRLAAQGNRTG